MILKILHSKDKQKVVDYIERLPDDKKYIVDVKFMREKRSIDQNKLYWLWLSCIMDETGEHKDRLHIIFKKMFLGVGTITVNLMGISYSTEVANSTTKLDTKEFTYYLERIQQFALTDLGIVLPNPKDRFWEEFYQKYKNFI